MHTENRLSDIANEADYAFDAIMPKCENGKLTEAQPCGGVISNVLDRLGGSLSSTGLAANPGLGFRENISWPSPES